MKTSSERPEPIRANSLSSIPVNIKSLKRYMKQKTQYYNYPVAFDIESSSFYDDGEKRGCMYVWQMCFGDSELLIYGRTWEEFLSFMKKVCKHFRLSERKILPIYCHNLAFEFQWICKLFTWKTVFSLEKRVPLYARTTTGIEFRCSYRLSGYNLEKTAENLLTHDISKLTGSLDYNKVRHSSTPLTQSELDYCMNDVRVVCALIQERIESDGSIIKIPMTKTGYVRRDCREACYGKDHNERKYFKYRETMNHLTITPEEFTMQRDAFMGGYTHGNCLCVDRTIYNVTSMDFTSSYPYVLFAYKYPWSKGELCYPTIDEIFARLHMYAWVIEIEMYGVESKVIQDDYISFSKCHPCKGYVLNNGRVNRADYIRITVTSVDLEIIMNTYRVTGGIKVVKAYRYYLSYLPTDFIKEMLVYYKKKTELKDVPGKVAEYFYNKEQQNSFYGMVVQNPIKGLITFDREVGWDEKPVDLYKGVEKYNNSKSRFMPYVVGVFVTAYARRNLWDGILNVGEDYLYSDTDSIKMVNFEKHKEYFEEYNNKVFDLLHKACDHHKIPFEMVTPKTVKGIEKPLGVWDFDGFYTRFKTLGSKRYMVEEDGDIIITVSGLSKTKAAPYMVEKYGKEGVFDAFTDDPYGVDTLVIPGAYSGRMVSTYIDEETSGFVVDYMGNAAPYHEMSSIHLENTTYTLSLSQDYIRFLFGIRKEL